MEHPTDILIVSVHVHKNAGMNFKKHLIKKFGGQLFLSYGRDKRVLQRFFTTTNVPHIKKSELDNIRIVHGHFLADLFDPLADEINYAIFFRDPVERVISNYYFFKNNYFKHSPVCKMIAEGMTLEEYAALSSSRNVQSFFMADKPLESFDYVGICEEYEKSVLLFDRLFNVKGSITNSLNYYKYFFRKRFTDKSDLVLPESLTENKNPEKQTLFYDIDENLRNNIMELNYIDHNLYKRGRKHFKQNCEKYSV